MAAQAFKIAENELLLSEIGAHKIWVVERLRECGAVRFSEKDNSLQLGKARFMAAWLADRAIHARLPEVIRKYEPRLIEEAVAKPCADFAASLEGNPSLRGLYPEEADYANFIKECLDLRASHIILGLKNSHWRLSSDDIVPIRLKALLEEPEEEHKPAENPAVKEPEAVEWSDRDAYEALEAAVEDLIHLDRYEQRAWSRLKRSILALANIKLERRLRPEEPAALSP